MKKFLLLTLILSAAVMQAQSNEKALERKELTFGVKTGLNLSTLGGADVNDLNPKTYTNAYFGGFLHIWLSKRLAFQHEILLSLQGSKLEIGGETGRIRSTYINAPFMLKWYFIKKFNVEIGGQTGFILEDNAKLEGVAETRFSEIKTFNFGVNVGASYVFDIGLSLDARYHLGVTKVIPGELKIKNRVFSFGLGYSW